MQVVYKFRGLISAISLKTKTKYYSGKMDIAQNISNLVRPKIVSTLKKKYR